MNWAARAEITDADIAAQQSVLKAEAGQPEYRAAEIFLPIEDPTKTADTQRFADTVIGQLRSGAPFAVVAAQFSQSQTALQGGDLGWVGPSSLDPQVAKVLSEMPEGAVSNPIQVPGGIIIVTLKDKREVGRDMATVLVLRTGVSAVQHAAEPAGSNRPAKEAAPGGRKHRQDRP